jgi:hypothetical protein
MVKGRLPMEVSFLLIPSAISVGVSAEWTLLDVWKSSRISASMQAMPTTPVMA